MERINVIIANKDYTKFLPDAVLSCLKQTFKVNFTIIDDGSIDKPEVPPNYKHIEGRNYDLFKNDEGNRYIFLKESVGPSLSRNVGIMEAFNDSDYFMILDADDMMLKNKCETLLNVMREDPSIGVAYGDYYILDESGLMKMEFKRPYSRRRLERDCIVHSGSLIRKEALIAAREDNNFYDPSMRVAEDYDLWLRISEKMMIKHVPEFLSIVRNHRNNSSNSVDHGIWNQCLNRLHAKRLKRLNG